MAVFGITRIETEDHPGSFIEFSATMADSIELLRAYAGFYECDLRIIEYDGGETYEGDLGGPDFDSWVKSL